MANGWHDRTMRLASVNRKLVLTLVALTALGWGACQWWNAAFRDLKDRRDLLSLTAPLPWENGELRVPDAVRHEDDADASASPLRFDVVYRRGPDTEDGPVIHYAMHHMEDGNTFEDIAGCGAKAVRSCTTIGDAETLAITHDTHNSDPGLALYRDLGDLVVSVSGEPGHVDSRLLRHVLDHTHRPADAELLELLRPPGYQTDWS